jgi:probable addiction module antidote protein
MPASKKMKKRSVNYREDLMRALKNPEEAAAYINAALEEGDTRVLLTALKNVADANGGIGKLAAKTKLARESLYRMLSKKGNPEPPFFSHRIVVHVIFVASVGFLTYILYHICYQF